MDQPFDVAPAPAADSITTPGQPEQYTLGRVLTIWLAAALPMGVLAWALAPLVVGRIPLPSALTFSLLMMVGLAWQAALGLWIIRREEGGLSWAAFRRRTWLVAPRHPRTGRMRRRSFTWVLPGWLIGFLVLTFGVLLGNTFLRDGVLRRLLSWTWLPPFPSPGYAQVTELISPEFAGRWWLLALVAAAWVLSLAEELIFRGVLLPKMAGAFGRWDWVANAGLYGLYHLHKPWMIPFRFIYGLILAGPARRFRSSWLAIAIRGVEGLGLLALALIGITSPSLTTTPIPDLAQPHVAASPQPLSWYRGPLPALPRHTPDATGPFEIDMRGYDLSALDLRDATDDLLYVTFDSRTLWPPAERMPTGFDQERILALGRNPGLDVRSLHDRGSTGRGVGIAIVDQALLVEHQEYAGQLRWYEQTSDLTLEPASMHGPAVASIAVGQTVGVAPEADLYFIAVTFDLRSLPVRCHSDAQAVRRILQINRQLPADRKIRVISISSGWLPEWPGYDDIAAALAEAKAAGLLVICSTCNQADGMYFHGLGRPPTADPDRFEAYEPGLFWAGDFAESGLPPDRLLAPMDSRTLASPTGKDEYAFYREGGWSWAIPYIAGAYALAAQVDPTITPDRFWALALQTGRTIEIGSGAQKQNLGKILDPVALIAAVQNASAAPGR